MKSKKLKPRRSKKITKILTDRVIGVMAKMTDDRDEVERLVNDGHNYECAYKIVFEDADCKCKQGEQIESYTQYDHWTENGERR